MLRFSSKFFMLVYINALFHVMRYYPKNVKTIGIIAILLCLLYWTNISPLNSLLQGRLPIPKAYASNTSIEQEVDITNAAFSSGGTNTGVILIDTAHYTGATYYFEVDSQVSSGSGTVTFTYNAGSAAIPSGGSTITISSISATTTTQYRSASFTPTGSQDAYMSGTTGTGITARARLIVVQASASTITNTVTQLDVGGTAFNISTTSTTYVPIQNAKGWTYNSSKYDGTVTAYFEATMEAASTKTVTAALFPFGTSCGTAVTSSAVTSDTSGSYQRVRSSDISANLSNGTTYMTCIKTVSGATGFLINAHLVIQQTSTTGITKVEIQHESMDQNDSVSNSSYTRELAPFLYEPGNWANATFTYYFEAAISVSAGTGNVELYNITDSSAITNSPVSTTSSTVALVRSGVLIMPTSTKTLDTETQAVGGGTVTLQGSWLIIDVSGMPGNSTTIEQEVDITNAAFSSGGTNTGVILIDTAHYTGATYYFEVDSQVSSGSGTVTFTYNAGSAAIPSGGSTIVISSISATTTTRYRSAAFTPTGSQNAYMSATSGTGITARARLIVVQSTGNTITNTVTQLDVGGTAFNISTASTTYVPVQNAKAWTYNSSKYDGTVTAYLDTTVSATSGKTVTAALFPFSTSCGTAVTGSAVTSDTSGSYQRLRSADISANLSNGTTYMTCIKTVASSTGFLLNAHLVIQQTSTTGITKVEIQHESMDQNDSTASNPYFSLNAPFLYEPANWSGGTFTYYFEGAISTSAGTGSIELYNVTDSAAIASSPVSTTSATVALVRSSALTMPVATKTLDTYMQGSGGTLNVQGSWLIIDASGLPQLPNAPTSLQQYRNDGSTVISNGGWTPDGITNNVVFSFTMSSPAASDTLIPAIELEPNATTFTGIPNYTGSSVAYSGTGVTGTVSVTGLINCTGYHWQAFVENAYGVSALTVFNVTTPNFSVASTAPSSAGVTVYDGSTTNVENTTTASTSTLNTNWASFTDTCSGLAATPYTIAIGTTPGGTNILGYTSTGVTTGSPNVYAGSSLALYTGAIMYITVKATNNAGLTTTVTSNGQSVMPIVSFNLNANQVSLGDVNSGNSFTATGTSTLTASSNAHNGYSIYAYETSAMELLSNVTITVPNFSAGSYASPAAWNTGTYGFGYTSSCTSIGGSNKYATGTLYAPFNTTGPGDIVAQNLTSITGTTYNPGSPDTYTITYKAAVADNQTAGLYGTSVTYSIVPTF